MNKRPSSSTCHRLAEFFFIVLFGLLIRIVSILYPATFDWDEHTFYKVAQESAKGNLPFTTTFEIKPPVSLIPQTLAFVIGVSDFRTLRFILTILLCGCAYLIMLILRQWGVDYVVSFLTALCFLALYTMGYGGTVWMSQVNVIAVSLLTIYFVNRKSDRSIYIASFLAGTIALVRTNFILLSVFLLFFIVYKKSLARLLVFFFFALPSIIIFLLYGISGNLIELFQGFLAAPFFRVSQLPNTYQLSDGMLLQALICFVLIFKTFLRSNNKEGLNILSGSFICVVLGASLSSPDYPHHTLQLIPFTALAIGLFANKFQQTILRVLAIAVIASISVLLSPNFYVNSVNELASISDNRNRNQIESRIVSDVQNTCGSSCTIYALDLHFVYWRLDINPPSPLLVHPSSISNIALLKAFNELPLHRTVNLQAVLSQRPELIIFSDLNNLSYLSSQDLALLSRELETHYKLSLNSPTHQIYKHVE